MHGCYCNDCHVVIRGFYALRTVYISSKFNSGFKCRLNIVLLALRTLFNGVTASIDLTDKLAIQPELFIWTILLSGATEGVKQWGAHFDCQRKRGTLGAESSAEGARIKAPLAPRGWGLGRWLAPSSRKGVWGRVESYICTGMYAESRPPTILVDFKRAN